MDLGIGVGGGLIDYGVSFDATILTQPRSVGIDDELPFGFLTARVGRQLGDFELLGHISGLGFEFGNEEINFIDIEGSLIWTFWYMKTGAAALEVGYRYHRTRLRVRPVPGQLQRRRRASRAIRRLERAPLTRRNTTSSGFPTQVARSRDRSAST